MRTDQQGSNQRGNEKDGRISCSINSKVWRRRNSGSSWTTRCFSVRRALYWHQWHIVCELRCSCVRCWLVGCATIVRRPCCHCRCRCNFRPCHVGRNAATAHDPCAVQKSCLHSSTTCMEPVQSIFLRGVVPVPICALKHSNIQSKRLYPFVRSLARQTSRTFQSVSYTNTRPDPSPPLPHPRLLARP